MVKNLTIDGMSCRQSPTYKKTCGKYFYKYGIFPHKAKKSLFFS